MPENIDAIAKAKARLLRREQEQQQADARLKAENARIRKLERQLSVRRATILGETIRDAELSPNEKAVIGKVLARRKELPKDWSKIADFLSAPVAPEDLGHYQPRRTDKGDKLEDAAE